MTSTPFSPTITAPTADNIQMDIDSNLEAQQAAQELSQAQEWVCAANKAQERHKEEWKRKEEEEEAQQIVAMEAAARKADLILEMERQFQLQVSQGISLKF